jgi:hypothetical protein
MLTRHLLHLPLLIGIACTPGRGGAREASVPPPLNDWTSAQVVAANGRLIGVRARGGRNYGAEDARLFLDRAVTVAPSIEIVVAHLAGSGPGYTAQQDSLMAVFGAAAQRADPRMRNLYFDVATNVTNETTPEEAALVAKRIRQVGVRHVLYGSDLDPPGGSIRAGWKIFRDRVPLTAGELRTIAGNVTAFAR